MDDSVRTLSYAAVGAGLALAGSALYRRLTRYDFSGRIVLITGGSRGLGLVLARQLVGHKARVVVCARDAGELEQAARDLAGRGGDVTTVVCDVMQQEQVTSMVERIASQLGPLDVVINNAGTIQTGPLETMTVDDYDEAMKTHFYGSLFVNEAALPQMRRRGAGRIVNVASIGGRISVTHLLPYCASKFALVGYSLGLRAALARAGVTVTTICPGLMRTGSPRNAYFKGQHQSEYALFKISSSLPLVSLNANRAARKILNACRHGDAFAVLGASANLADTIAAVCPGLAADMLATVNRLLPGPGGAEGQRLRGYESESRWSESWLTALTQKAATRNNEIGPN